MPCSCPHTSASSHRSKWKRLLICVAASPKETVPEGLGKSVWSVDTLLLMVPSEWPREPSLVPRFWKGQPKMLAGTWKLVDLGVHVHLKSVECPLEEQGWVGPEAQGQGTGPKGGGPIWLLWKGGCQLADGRLFLWKGMQQVRRGSGQGDTL